MTVYSSFEIPVDYHRQSDAIYCGSACVQMILSTVVGDLEAGDIEKWWVQETIDNGLLYQEKKIYGEDTTLEAPPKAVAKYLNQKIRQKRHPQINNSIADLKEYTVSDALDSTREALVRKIAWTLSQCKYPVPILRYLVEIKDDTQETKKKTTHWVVIKGYLANKEIESIEDTAFQVKAFFVYDPNPKLAITEEERQKGITPYVGDPHVAEDCAQFLDIKAQNGLFVPEYSASPQDLLGYYTWSAGNWDFNICVILPDFEATLITSNK
ncbi:MAG: hypothetical protein HXX08_23155 [Chloroflexi bacterium]|nr:hypothetical protein [Chloroflexota bacterium]